MKIQSALPKKQYLSAIKDRMGGHFDFGAERCTGFFLGSLFCVTYHSGWEWNRRITNQKNTAIGFVKTTENGCQVRCFTMKGFLAPQYFLLLLAFTSAIWVLMSTVKYSATDTAQYWLPFSLFITMVIAAAEAYGESLTQESEDGLKNLQSILLAPDDPFTYLNNHHRI